MSSRALRKLQQEKDAKELQLGGSDDEVSIVRPVTGARARRPNPFDLLNAADSLSESEVKEDDDLGDSVTQISLKALESQKRKQRNKKHKKKKPINNKSSEDNLEDDVEKSVREVNRILGEVPNHPDANSKIDAEEDPALYQQSATTRGLLSIEHKNLNPENEMKRMFGSKVVMADQHHRHKRGQRHRAPHSRSSHWLVVPKPGWPQASRTGLSMKFLESDKFGNQHFTFDHSASYQTIQKRFFHAVDSFNPEFIIQLLNEHPFHIDSMLQLSEICKMGEDSTRAAELVERTLYALEAAFHPLFNLAVGTSRLDYKRQENRAFFVAIFRHISNVGARACHRTALEFCKLALSLDPDNDPLGILLMLDFYAIRAQQHAWFVEFVKNWDPKKNLPQLPNIAYSLALATFYSGNSAGKNNSTENTNLEADEKLQRALIDFPGVLWPLLDKCSVDIDKRVMASPYFVEAQSKQPAALQLLSGLYCGRAHHLWRDPAILPWLEKNVHAVLDLVDSNATIIKEAAEKRQIRYQGTPRNIYRHVILSDIKDATTSLPRELAEEPVMSYDPLPPTDAIDAYSRNQSNRPNLEDPSVLGMFFRSLLPNFNPNDPNPPQQDEGAVAGQENPGDLRSSVNNLLEAMQNLLGGLHLPEVPQDASSEGADDDDDEWQ